MTCHQNVVWTCVQNEALQFCFAVACSPLRDCEQEELVLHLTCQSFKKLAITGGGGGVGEGCKGLCALTHITSTEPNSLSAGVQGPLKGPGSYRVVLMLSCAIWALF